MKNVLSNKKGLPNVWCVRCRRKLERGTIIKSVFVYRFKSNKHTHVFLFITEIFLFSIQIRRQDFAAGGAKPQGWQHFLNTILDVWSNRGAKCEMGTHLFNEGKGTIGPRWWWPCFYCTNTGLFWCAIWVYLKSLNGSPACDRWTETSLQAMQRDSDTADSAKPRIVIYCMKRSISKYVAVLPQVGKIHCSVRLRITCPSE